MINKLVLSDFRNYKDITVDFDATINLLVGENGQGKTNLLEAIYFIAYLRSFRTSNLSTLKRIGTKGFYIASEIKSENSWNKLLETEYYIQKSLRIDHLPIYKSSEFIGKIKPIIFSSTDIRLISDTSRIRRRFLDMTLSSLDKNYLFILQQYMKALRSRNAVLRNHQIDVSLVAAFEPILAEYAVIIIQKRLQLLKELVNKADYTLKKIKGDSYSLNVKYISKLKIKDITIDYIHNTIVAERERDTKRKYSGIGPHMDDIEFSLNGKDLKSFGSLGQWRLIVLCLKMAETEIITANDSDDRVIALVDDVTGELDSVTKDSFFKTLSSVNQLFFTLTKYDKTETYFKNASIYNISDGNVCREH